MVFRILESVQPSRFTVATTTFNINFLFFVLFCPLLLLARKLFRFMCTIIRKYSSGSDDNDNEHLENRICPVFGARKLLLFVYYIHIIHWNET